MTGTVAGTGDPMKAAMSRLDAALALLEAAVARRIEADDARGDRATELALMQEDRARLAAELDAAAARLAEMEAVAGDVGHRLDHAIGTVEDVLDAMPARAG